MWKKKQVKNDPEWIENKTLLLLPNKSSNEKITWFGQLYLPNQKLQNSKKKVPIPWRQKILEIPIHFCVTTQKNKEILNGKLHFSAVRPILNLMRFMPERLRKIWLKSKY